MNFDFNPTGKDLAPDIKELIDKLPEEVFYPTKMRRKKEIVEKRNDDVEKDVIEVVPPKITQPLVVIRDDIKENAMKMEEERLDQERIAKEKEIEERRIKDQEIDEFNTANRLQNIQGWITQKLKAPTESLLGEFFNPKEDTKESLQMLYHFEKTGTFLHKERKESPSDNSQNKYSPFHAHEDEIEVDVKIPDNLPKDPVELRKKLEEFERKKKTEFSRLQNQVNEEKFKILLSLQSHRDVEKKGEWKEYIESNYIKPGEKNLFSKIHKPYEPLKDPILDDIHQAEAIRDDTERNQFQFDHPLTEDSLLKKMFRSNL